MMADEPPVQVVDQLDPLRERVLELCKAGRYQAALPQLEQLVSESPEDSWAWYTLGAAASRFGDYLRARAALEMALACGEGTARSHAELGVALSRLSEYSKAIEELKLALAMNSEPTLLPHLHEQLGFAYSKSRRPKDALEAYTAASEADPLNVDAWRGIGSARAALKDYGGSVEAFRRSTELAPEDPQQWYALGRVLAWAGNLEPARDALERAIRLGFPDGTAHAQLAWVYQRMGDARAATDEARKALRQTVPKSWRAWVTQIANDSAKQHR
jgi:tetratricopeptide (TPR) repeat protein